METTQSTKGGFSIRPVLHANGSRAYELRLPFQNPAVRWTYVGQGVVQYSIDVNYTLTIVPQKDSYYHLTTTLEIPVFSVGYTYDDVTLSNFYGTFRLLLRDSKTLEVQTSTSKRCIFKTEDMIVCSADGTMAVVTTPTSTWPSVHPDTTTLLDPAASPERRTQPESCLSSSWTPAGLELWFLGTSRVTRSTKQGGSCLSQATGLGPNLDPATSSQYQEHPTSCSQSPKSSRTLIFLLLKSSVPSKSQGLFLRKRTSKYLGFQTSPHTVPDTSSHQTKAPSCPTPAPVASTLYKQEKKILG
ncbi:hypothetical protein FQN60_011466 [Etheostoma spectabile]|uniref:ZP-domain containing protein Ig-like domain-containing protein n=1 Tax=Etheostoma spectabile TaxID=54343 RepID=A0A5J5C8A2_9PERO|nr:hypothetical protein FQN60_011466 [Etheostoma spectabile]